MKTYIVRQGDQSWLQNAETPVEAVKYALARHGLEARPGDRYDVIDHDCDHTIVTIITTTANAEAEEAEDQAA